MIQVQKRPDWFKQGNCWGRPQITHLFYADDEEGGSAPGRQYCERCPVASECRDYAISEEIHYGLWGGLTYRERERYKRNPAAFIQKKSTCEECGELLTGKRRIFCSARCVRRASAKRKRQNTMLLPAPCEVCGEEFPRRHPTQVLCSDKCRKESVNLRTARNRTIAKRTVACWVCDSPVSSMARYCSDPCRAKARQLRKASA